LGRISFKKGERNKWFTEGGRRCRTDHGSNIRVGIALHELLRRVRDVGMLLLSVNRVQTGYADAADGEPSIDARNADTDVCHRTPASFNRFPQLS
jgi:hypothetical protein